jgi:hypothetical protein
VVRLLVTHFVPACRRELPAMRTMIDRQEFSELSDMARRLESVAMPLGFPELSAHGAALLASARFTDAEKAHRQVSHMEEYLASNASGWAGLHWE